MKATAALTNLSVIPCGRATGPGGGSALRVHSPAARSASPALTRSGSRSRTGDGSRAVRGPGEWRTALSGDAAAKLLDMNVIALVSQKGGSGKTTLAAALAVAHQHRGDARPSPTSIPRAPPSRGTTSVRAILPSSRPCIRRAWTGRSAPSRPAASTWSSSTPPHTLPPGPWRPRTWPSWSSSPAAPPHPIWRRSGRPWRLPRSRARTRLSSTPNAAPPRGPLALEAAEAVTETGAQVAPVTLGARIAHVHAFTLGRTAQEFEPRAKAAAEVRALYHWMAHELHRRGETP